MTGKSEVKTNPSNGSTIYRCVTYNILSKPLARTEQFVTKTRDELDWECRFPKIKTKLTNNAKTDHLCNSNIINGRMWQG